MKQEERLQNWKRANEALDAHQVGFDDKNFIRSAFSQMHLEKYPFIESQVIHDLEDEDESIEQFCSTYKDIKSLYFETRNEVKIVNAMYIATKDKFEPNLFRAQIKFVFRLMGLESEWTK